MRVANFFEEDYDNIHIVPAENLEWCVDQQRAIDQFSEAHRAEIGWTDAYALKPVPVSFASRRIRGADLHAAISAELTPFDQVTYEHRIVCEPSHTSAYGPDPSVVLFAEHDDDLVRELWAILQPDEPSQIDAVIPGLEKLTAWDLILVDWGWSRVIPLTDVPQLRSYLQNRLTVFTAPPEQPIKRQRSWSERIKSWFNLND
jgi:hypothetical protein